MTSETPGPGRPGHDDPTPDPARWRALIVCLLAGAMTLLDISIVNVALPSLRTELGADESDLQWIVAGYALAFGVVLVPAGRLGDARSRRRVFVAGVALFTLASAAAGAAPNPELLAAARIIQGIGGGLIAPQVSGFIQNLFRGAERARAFGLFGATVGISTAIGPLLGGLLVGVGGPEWGWRLVFYVNVPIGAVVIPLALRLLPGAGPRRQRESLDPVGVVLFTLAVLMVLFPLVEGGQGRSLADRPWWLLAPAVGLLVGFVAWERHWQRRHATLIDLQLLKIRSYVFGLVVGHLLLRRLHRDLPGHHALSCRTVCTTAPCRPGPPRPRSRSVRRSRPRWAVGWCRASAGSWWSSAWPWSSSGCWPSICWSPTSTGWSG